MRANMYPMVQRPVFDVLCPFYRRAIFSNCHSWGDVPVSLASRICSTWQHFPCQELPLCTPCILIIIGDAQRDDVIPARLSFARILSRSTTRSAYESYVEVSSGMALKYCVNTCWNHSIPIPVVPECSKSWFLCFKLCPVWACIGLQAGSRGPGPCWDEVSHVHMKCIINN